MFRRKKEIGAFDPDLDQQDGAILVEGIPEVIAQAATATGVTPRKALEIVTARSDRELADLGMDIIEDNSRPHFVRGNVGLAVRSVCNEMRSRRD